MTDQTFNLLGAQVKRILFEPIRTFMNGKFNESIKQAQAIDPKTFHIQLLDLKKFQAVLRKISTDESLKKELVAHVLKAVEPKEKLVVLIDRLINYQSVLMANGIGASLDKGSILTVTPEVFIQCVAQQLSARLFPYPSLMRRFESDTEQDRQQKSDYIQRFFNESVDVVVLEASHQVIDMYLSRPENPSTVDVSQKVLTELKDEVNSTLGGQMVVPLEVTNTLKSVAPSRGGSALASRVPSPNKAQQQQIPPVPRSQLQSALPTPKSSPPKPHGQPTIGALEQDFYSSSSQ
jgi:hypothetical protein